MLTVISIESCSEDLNEQIHKTIIEGFGRDVSDYEIDNLKFILSKNGNLLMLLDDESQNTKSVSKELLQFIEINSHLNYKLFTRTRLSEGALRKLRSFEENGIIAFHCYLVVGDTIKDIEYKELNRLIKSSQNKPISANWVSCKNSEEISIFVDNLLKSLITGMNYPIDILPKITSRKEKVETPLSFIMREYYSKLKDRQINWYPKKFVNKKMDEEKWGVDPLPLHEQGSVKRHVLVTGTGRSGTTYFSSLLTMLGLDVGHQRNGADGCSGAEFAKDHDWYPWFPVYGGGDCANVGERRSDYGYSHVLHIVRHPLWCIPSLQKNYPAINPEFWADCGVMDPSVMDQTSIVRNATMYYSINKFIDDSKQAEYRCQLEQIHDNWDVIMGVLDMKGTKDPELGAVNKAASWGRYEPLTWEKLEDSVGKKLSNAIKEQAKSYGYE